MNRIYQGRVASVSFRDDEENWVANLSLADQSECPLWRHHCIFQDAVNYYLLALGSLADSENSGGRVIKDLRLRLEAAWEQFPRSDLARRGARSLRDSIGPWLGLESGSSIDEAFRTVLEGNSEESEVLALSLRLLLSRCSGDSAIQQGGRGYFPRFCNKAYKGSWDFSTEAIEAEVGKSRLSEVLHGNPDPSQLEEIANEMSLSWTVKVSDKFFSGEEARDRLREAVTHVAAFVSSDQHERVKEVLAPYPDAHSSILSLTEKIGELPDSLQIPRNRKANKELTFLTLLFQYFPSSLLAALLKLFVKAPSREVEATDSNEGNFDQFGDDPIKIARGSRGFVFRAFTALPSWNPPGPGEPTWKEFDIAAFKEALKTLNQFNQKTDERDAARRDLEGRIAYQMGKPVAGWKPAKTESGEDEMLPPILGNDPRFELARALERELTEDLNETGASSGFALPGSGEIYQESDWKISRASLRGFRDIADKWNLEFSAIKEAEEEAITQRLEEIVKSYQADEKNRRSVGSLPLFFALSKPEYWDLWRVDSEMGNDEIADEEIEGSFVRPEEMLYAIADFHDLVRDYHRSQEAINLTPAEPRYSRRLYLFSDIGGRVGKVVFGGVDGEKAADDDSWIEAAVAFGENDRVSAKRVRLLFSAPRLHRDQLIGGEASKWLQPMMEALGIDATESEQGFKSAVGLMPDFDRSGNLRHLLNFPVDLNPSKVLSAIGKAEPWRGQFNGIRGKSLHLHWPGTAKSDAARRNPWWESESTITNGFTVLSTDLGQRTAGAWSLVKATASDPRLSGTGTRKPVRQVGNDGERTWFGEIIATGMHRLPGEDAVVQKKHGTFEREAWGKSGRSSRHDEWVHAKGIASELLAADPSAWVGATVNEKSFPEQNDSLIALANRRLTRLNTFHRWSCFDPDREEVIHRREVLIGNLRKELEAWRDEEVRELIDTLGNPADEFVDCNPSALRQLAKVRFLTLRTEMESLLIAIANRVAPLRDRSWIWKHRGDESPYGELVDEGERPEVTPWIRGQRGLSLARIEQLENLRRLFLRYNRALDREPGEAASFGLADRGRQSGEPCTMLLQKIDAMKEQRVNQTAHLILAQALGVKLKPHEVDNKERLRRDLHGEYEQIPGREPVDFIVIENLDRYLTSQGRSPSENSRLMKWAHRAIRDKLKMIAEEAFGIPVVEVAAAYSSRFCAKTGSPGSRAVELPKMQPYVRQALEKKAQGTSADAELHLSLLSQFDRLEEVNSGRKCKKPRTLIYPRAGGSLFLSASAESGNPVQADINAASNLAFRAIAAPDRIDLLHRIRTEKKGNGWIPVRSNKRELAAYNSVTAIQLESDPSRKLKESQRPNFFCDTGSVAEFDRATLEVDGRRNPIASGVGLWASVNQRFLEKVVTINQARLANWEVSDSPIESDEDVIPGL